jgi:hypothetical protein
MLFTASTALSVSASSALTSDPRRVRQHPEGSEVWDEPNLADGPQAVHRLELIEPVHGLHRDGKSDPALEPTFQAVAARCLRPHGAVVAAPEETDQAQACFVSLANYLTTIHGERHDACDCLLRAR